MKRKILRTVSVSIVIVVFMLSVYTNRITETDNKTFYDKNGIFFHELDADNLYGDELYHYEDEKYCSRLGTDVSVFNGNIDFSILKKAGIEFVYIRIGYRGYQSGDLFLDRHFESNYLKAKEAGLDVGVYFVTSAVNSSEVEEEIEFMLKKLQNKKIDLPLALDLEEIYYDTARTDDMGNEDITKIIHSYFSILEKHNKKGILYTNTAYINEHLNISEIAEYPLWLAQYSDFPDYEYPFEIWQYTESGHIEGIDGELDLNLMFTAR